MVFDANSCATLQLRQLGGHGASSDEDGWGNLFI